LSQFSATRFWKEAQILVTKTTSVGANGQQAPTSPPPYPPAPLRGALLILCPQRIFTTLYFWRFCTSHPPYPPHPPHPPKGDNKLTLPPRRGWGWV